VCSQANQKARAPSPYRKKHKDQREQLPTTKKSKVKSIEQKVCGIDVHRDTLVATILDIANHKQTQTFQNNTTDMENLKHWLKTNNTIDVVMESTGSYWTTLYMTLEDANFKPILANAHQVKTR
jgi:hypothetical protein